MLKNQDVQFSFRKTEYRIHFVDCFVFPQSYSAVVRRIDSDKKTNDFKEFSGTVMMADIGNGTMNMILTEMLTSQAGCSASLSEKDILRIAEKSAEIVTEKMKQVIPAHLAGYTAGIPAPGQIVGKRSIQIRYGRFAQ